MSYEIGTHIQIKAAQYEQLIIVPLTDTTAVLVYKDGTPTIANNGVLSNIFARVVTLDGLDITLGPEHNLSTTWSTCVNVGACKVDDDKIAVAIFGTNINPWHGHYAIATITGTTITPGALGPDLFDFGLGIPRLEQLETDKFIVGRALSGGGETKPAFQAVAVTGTTPVPGTVVGVYTRNSDAVDITVLSPTSAVMIFRQTKFAALTTWCSAVTIAGTVISTGTRREVAPADLGIENTAIGKLDSTHACIFYRDSNNSNLGTTKVAIITGTAVSLQAAEVFSGAAIDNPVAISNPRTSDMVGGYIDASNQGIIRDAVRSGNNTVWDDEVVLHDGPTSYLAMSHMTDTVSLAMYTDTNDGDIKAVAFRPPPTIFPISASGNLVMSPGGHQVFATSFRIPYNWKYRRLV